MLPLFATRVCVCIVGVVRGQGCVVLTDATIVCHSCVCVYCGCGTWAGMRSINLCYHCLPLVCVGVLWVLDLSGDA